MAEDIIMLPEQEQEPEEQGYLPFRQIEIDHERENAMKSARFLRFESAWQEQMTPERAKQHLRESVLVDGTLRHREGLMRIATHVGQWESILGAGTPIPKIYVPKGEAMEILLHDVLWSYPTQVTLRPARDNVLILGDIDQPPKQPHVLFGAHNLIRIAETGMGELLNCWKFLFWSPDGLMER